MNPQIASRLVMPLCQWGRLESSFQEVMKSELQRMVAKELSKDLYEIISKSSGLIAAANEIVSA